MAAPADKRETIIKAASKIFGSKGYYGAHMDEIAATAGVSPKTIYKYFDGKQALFIECRHAAVERLRTEMMSHVSGRPRSDAFSAVRSAIESYGEFVRRNQGAARILAEGVAVVDPVIRREHERQFEENVAVIASIIETDVADGKVTLKTEPRDAASQFLAFMSTLVYSILLGLDRNGRMKPDVVVDIFYRAVRQ